MLEWAAGVRMLKHRCGTQFLLKGFKCTTLLRSPSPLFSPSALGIRSLWALQGNHRTDSRIDFLQIFFVLFTHLLIVPFVSVQEHGLGTDVSMKAPDRPVSSFAAQLQFGSAPGKTLLIKHASVGSLCDSFCVRGIEQCNHGLANSSKLFTRSFSTRSRSFLGFPF